MTPHWLVRAWDEALEEDRERAERRRRPFSFKGFRLPKRGAWELEMPGLRALLPDAPRWSWAAFSAVLAGIAGALFFPVAWHLTALLPPLTFLPIFGMSQLALGADACPVVQSVADRTQKFPSPLPNQQVFNKATGNIERFDPSVGWLTEVFGVGPTGAGLPGTTATVATSAYARGTSGNVQNDNAVAVNAAVAAAPGLGASIVYVVAAHLPYTAGNVAFNTAIKMTAEGANPGTYDLQAYGADSAPGNTTDSITAIQVALNVGNSVTDVVVHARAGEYRYSNTVTVPAHTVLRGDGYGRSGGAGGTLFHALASVPINTPHFKLGTGAALDFSCRIEDCRIHCSQITGSVAVTAPTIQEFAGLKRVMVQAYMNTGIQLVDPGGGLFSDNYVIEDCICGCSSTATGSIGVDCFHDTHRGGVIRKLSVVPDAAPADQLAGVRVLGVTAAGGGISIYDLNVERHTDAINVGINGSVSVYHAMLNVSGTNVVHIVSGGTPQEVALFDLYRSVGTATVVNDYLGESVTTTRVQFYCGSDTAEGYQVFTSAGSTSTHGNVMGSSVPVFRVKSTATSTGAARSAIELIDGLGNGIHIRGANEDGAGNPLQIYAVAGNVVGALLFSLRRDNAVTVIGTDPGGTDQLRIGGAIITTKRLTDGVNVPTWGASIAIDASAGAYQTITATSNIAATVQAPTNAPAATFSEDLTLEFFNNSGGALTTPIAFATGAGAFLASGGVSPANGLSIEVKFRWNQARSRWIEVSRGAAV